MYSRFVLRQVCGKSELSSWPVIRKIVGPSKKLLISL